MRPPRPLTLLASAASLGLAEGLRRAGDATECISSETDLVAYALMTQRVCEFNYALDPKLIFQHPDVSIKGVTWAKTMEVAGCWTLRQFNTDQYFTTAVYQNGGRCVLAISGYHASANGLMRTINAATEPRETLLMCDNEVHAPVVTQFRKHTASANWSSIVEHLGGPGSTCRDIVVTGDSMGGSTAPLVADCASRGQLDSLYQHHLPSFAVNAVYTFGAFASSLTPLRNASSKDGCIKGKRIFHATDQFAQWAKSIGMKHAQMDAIMLSEKDGRYSYETLHCGDPGTVDSDADIPFMHQGGNNPSWAARKAKNSIPPLTSHAITHYVKQLNGMTKLGAAPQLRSLDYVDQLREIQL